MPPSPYSRNQLAVFVLANPLLSERLALAQLGDVPVANGLFQLLDGETIHGLAEGLKDTRFMTTMGGNLLSLGFQDSLLSLDRLVGDHGARAQSVEGSFDILGCDGGEGL